MDSFTEQDWKNVREDGTELIFSVADIRAFFDTGDPIEDVDNALDKAQGDAMISGTPKYVVIKVHP